MNRTAKPLRLEPGEAPVLIVALGSCIAAAILRSSGSDAYAFVLGDAEPVAITLAASGLALLALRILARVGWCQAAGGRRRGHSLALLLGIVLPIPVIVVDALGGFAQGINVPAPQSLLFYPAIAFVAETAFHAVPVALVALATGLVGKQNDRALSWGMVAAALIEPILQVRWGTAHSPVWANAYVGVHLLVFNLIGVSIFRRYGFLTVYLFRVAYYVVWHIVWGHFRLGVLFGG